MSFKRKGLAKMRWEMNRSTAHIWQKEAAFHQYRSERFIQNMVEFEGISAVECIIRHTSKVKKLLVKDREESDCELFSHDTLFTY